MLTFSHNRLACVLYLLDLLLQLDVQTPSRGTCITFWEMPLPCSGAIWQATSEHLWKPLWQEVLANRIRQRWTGLTLGDVLMLRQSNRLDQAVAKAGGSALAEELVDWCDHADDLSMALWTAFAIDGEGQSRGSDVLSALATMKNGLAEDARKLSDMRFSVIH